MKKTDVQIGETYSAKVSGSVVRVRIDGENRHGGWDATNLTTKKTVRIKSAQRLRARVSKKAPTPPDSNHCATVGCDGESVIEHLGRQRCQKCWDDECAVAADGQKPKAAKRAKPGPVVAKRSRQTKPADAPKRLSALDAAAQILQKKREAMRAGELIAAMAESGLWSSPNGKTPDATLYAAMVREINTKGKDARFKKIDAGKFEYAGGK